VRPLEEAHADVLLVIEGGAVPIPLGEPALPGRPGYHEGYRRGAVTRRAPLRPRPVNLELTRKWLIGHFVDQARRSGASWTEIGKSMGVTKQAAQKRFVPKEPGQVPAVIPFDQQARKALELTFREALRMGP
jgi:hypothetical protein